MLAAHEFGRLSDVIQIFHAGSQLPVTQQYYSKGPAT
jgi:hypothetical protein